ncbi:MAG: tetratricopeptide repeat protein [Planctomycetaceae bacterium]|nr:tetratricopeptide repeat protein [Planctomycetaceae bacterium]
MTAESFEQEKSRVLPLLKQQQYAAALEILEQMQCDAPGQRLELLEMQAMCYFRMKRYEQAAACYQQLAEADPRSAKPLVNLGAVYNRLHRYNQAIDSLRRAIQRDRANVDAYYNLGYAQRHNGHPDLAISAYKEAIRLDPKLDLAHIQLANLYLDLKNLVMATTHYRAALLITPEMEVALQGLQRVRELELQLEQHKNPFGRLVDANRLHQNTGQEVKRLSEGERHKDREELVRLVKGVRNASRHVSEEIREKMYPALQSLTRALIDGEHRPDLVSESHNRFHEERNRFQEGLRYLKRSVLELRGHEEFMNTPDLDV